MNTGQKKSHLEHRTAWYRTSCSHTLIKCSNSHCSSLRHTEASARMMVSKVKHTLLKVKHEGNPHISWSYFIGLPEEWVVGTSLVDDVSYQVLLAVVGGQYADAFSRISQQTHVHEQRHWILGLCQILQRQTHTYTGYMDSTSLTIQLIMPLLTISTL